jgi:hypothetical protein
MSLLLDAVLPPLDFEPSIPGLEVIEPPPDLVPLAWLGWDDAVRAQDDQAAYAVTHKEVLR